MSNDLKNTISQSIQRGYRAYLNNDVYLALESLNEAINEAEKEDQKENQDVQKLTMWAHAYLGEIHLNMAVKMVGLSEDQQGELYESLKHFNLSLQLGDDLEPLPLSDNIKKNQVWILAHRGELLRTMGNKMKNATNKERDNYYNAAIDCFKKATDLSPDYAWAYAHWGATLCNQRGNYQKALALLNNAIDLSEYRYAWAYAYRAITSLQLEERQGGTNNHVYAFYDFAIAMRQDPSIIRQVLEPPASFEQKLTPGQLYLEAMWAYQEALQYRPRDHRQWFYIRYYRLVNYKFDYVNVGDDFPEYSSNIRQITEFTNIWYAISKKLKSAHDVYYIEGSMIALYFRDVVLEQQASSNSFLNILYNFQGVKRLLYQSIIQEQDIASLPYQATDDDVNLFIQDNPGDYSSEDKEFMKKIMSFSLSRLSQCINKLQSPHRQTLYMRKARKDTAWYYLRTQKKYRELVNLE